MFPEIPAELGCPTLVVIEPFKPSNLLLRKIMFNIPAVPSASYLAEGDVMTSTFSIASAGNCLNASVELSPTNPEGLPLMSIRTLSLPLKATLPSASTETDGTLSKTSLTEPPLTVRSLPTLYIFLSSFNSTVVLSAIISTACKASKLISK